MVDDVRHIRRQFKVYQARMRGFNCCCVCARKFKSDSIYDRYCRKCEVKLGLV